MPGASGGQASITRNPSERKSKPERAVLAGFARQAEGEDPLDELALLAGTAGAATVGRILQRRSTVHPGNFLSRGKLEEARSLISDHGADLLICDVDLSPAQVRNLEETLEVRAVDRSELILDIFAQRARTREAKLQVELAQLRYLLPRLTGMWGHLSRTGGGIGTRGPGETQLEVDRRRVRRKISMLEARLEDLEVERKTQARRRLNAFRISLVGYTNAGKSTLFNRLTRSSVLEENKLFATLDTTTRRLALPGGVTALLSDTVGFIRDLPHHLVASFRATLSEVGESDLLIHVVDAGHPSRGEQMRIVEEVLGTLLDHPVPRLLVLNKADLVVDEGQELALRVSHPEALLISALRREDQEEVRRRIMLAVRDLRLLVRIECPADRLSDLRKVTRGRECRAEGQVDGIHWSEWWLDRQEVSRLRHAGFRIMSGDEWDLPPEPSSETAPKSLLAGGADPELVDPRVAE